jgi:protein subunit release factor A
LTLHKLEDFLAGNLDLVVEPLQQEQQAELLSTLGV